ncbi:hypothetical protein SS1G_08771 [Sclerotinia sclerotiorum 1980 UF-70]|uniref:Peroxisomal D3,D2-enoyl-CoA isomerase n=2 Tax=Sclerotinia sclerotiorum (strain ATCC 18683 / 1980 / Ss-1) TaxID=665079 RepID=A0A1D9QJP4_SCLS1|nr:hypothetical protein SS1G_08771 [Sclerotinia sclerotiorum 1980 UF-70]APA15167.1 hypothetical protein sscle_14g099370 [Sclerotinia sclerotiorum 1980 UF-70]EDN92906.1 hypothetical protein SS1G_08771 [Sclerotinia sclerotiorum 1980 UF-70]
MSKNNYKDIIVTIKNRIGIIKFNRPQALNSFGGTLLPETIAALRELNEHPDTVFTVLTGEGRFFCAGADVRQNGGPVSEAKYASAAEKKIAYLSRFTLALELMRSIIDHTKVFILAMNGPAVGAGAAWFPGVADIVIASTSTYLEIPFSALGLVPECGSAISLTQSMGVHRANEFLMFGRKLNADEILSFGIANRIFEKEGFGEKVTEYLEGLLDINDGKSMMEAKRLQNLPLRDSRILAVYNSIDALAERFVDGAPNARFQAKRKEMEAKSKNRTSKI